MLWVDKYRPTSLKGVIGQQGPRSCASKLLQWLKDWGRHHGAGSEGGAQKKPTGGWGESRLVQKGSLSVLVQTTPLLAGFGGGDGSQFKAALLSGPPGVGKTTTATLACKVCEW